jgi:hypothetical protein
VVRRVVQGTKAAVAALLAATQGGGVLNTAYIERLNATFRQRLASRGRRSRHLARQETSLQAGMYLVGSVYNWSTYHASLTLPDRWGMRRTPAMAAGLTDHCWSVQELLEYKVPLARWQPPKKWGRRSKAEQELVARWAA